MVFFSSFKIFFSFEKFKVMVPRRGLEPPRLSALDPKSSVYTNFTTWAHLKRHLFTAAHIIWQELYAKIFPLILDQEHL